MKRAFIFLSLFLALLCLLFGCSSIDLENGSDPEGTITLNLTQKGDKWGNVEIGNDILLGWGRGNISCVQNNDYYQGYLEQLSSCFIVDLGKKRLASVNTSTLPKNGWMEEIACEVGHSYICATKRVDYSKYEYVYFFSAFYVVENIIGTSNSIIGVKIKACPFSPEGGWNSSIPYLTDNQKKPGDSPYNNSIHFFND